MSPQRDYSSGGYPYAFVLLPKSVGKVLKYCAFAELTHLSFTTPAQSRQGLTCRPPSSDTPPLYDATFIPYAGGRRIPGAGEYRIELDRVR